MLTSRSVTALLPRFKTLRILAIDREPRAIIVHLGTIKKSTRCPVCRHFSRHVHDRFIRTLRSLPCCGMCMTFQVHGRRFTCRNLRCPRRTFREDLSELATRYARRTMALRSAHEQVGLELGGQAGGRLAHHLQMPVSRSTLLREVTTRISPVIPTPRVLGVDDWCWKKGRRYGTILIDLERHRVIDLLPDRSAETFAAWLRAHPGVAIISRDRGGTYAEGARQGAPHAIQVADRWHLLKNLGDQIEQYLVRKPSLLQQAAKSAMPLSSLLSAATPAEGVPMIPQVKQAKQESRGRRLARYTAIQTLFAQGISRRVISRQLGLARNTVRQYLRTEQFPERVARRFTSHLMPFLPYLRERWNAGEQNAHRLWEELKGRGYQGAASTVRSWLSRWRTGPQKTSRKTSAPSSPITCTPHQTRWLLLQPEGDWKPEERHYLAVLLEQNPCMALVQTLCLAFKAMIRDRAVERLEAWLGDAQRSEIAELRSFVAGVRRDLAAVEAGIQLEWSNGQTEGQVNRLKLVKRQMYGRAGFAVLRQRVVRAT